MPHYKESQLASQPVQPNKATLDKWMKESVSKLKTKIKDNLLIRLNKSIQVINHEIQALLKGDNDNSNIPTSIPANHPHNITQKRNLYLSETVGIHNIPEFNVRQIIISSALEQLEIHVDSWPGVGINACQKPIKTFKSYWIIADNWWNRYKAEWIEVHFNRTRAQPLILDQSYEKSDYLRQFFTYLGREHEQPWSIPPNTKRREIRDAAKTWALTMVRNKEKMYDLIVMHKQISFCNDGSNSNLSMNTNVKQFKMMNKVNPTRSRRGIYNGFNSKRNTVTQNRSSHKLRPKMNKINVNEFEFEAKFNKKTNGDNTTNGNTFNNRKSEPLTLGNMSTFNTLNNINGTHLNLRNPQKNTQNPLLPPFVDHVSSLMNNNNIQQLQAQQPQMMDIDENIIKFLQSTMNQNTNINNITNIPSISALSPLSLNVSNVSSSSLPNCGNNMMMNMNNINNTNILSTAFDIATVQQNTQNTQNNLKLHSNPNSILLPSLNTSPMSPCVSSPNNMNPMNVNQSMPINVNVSPKMVNLLRPPSSYIPDTSQAMQGLNGGNGGNVSNNNNTTRTSTNGSRSPLGMDYDLLSQNSGDTVMSDTKGDFANIELITLLCQAVLNGNGDNDKINQDMNKIIKMQNLSQNILNATDVMRNMPAMNNMNMSNLVMNNMNTTNSMPKLDGNLLITDNNNTNNSTNKITE